MILHFCRTVELSIIKFDLLIHIYLKCGQRSTGIFIISSYIGESQVEWNKVADGNVFCKLGKYLFLHFIFYKLNVIKFTSKCKKPPRKCMKYIPIVITNYSFCVHFL